MTFMVDWALNNNYLSSVFDTAPWTLPVPIVHFDLTHLKKETTNPVTINSPTWNLFQITLHIIHFL